MAASKSVSSVVFSRYANALIDLAEQSKVLEQVSEDLQSFLKTLEGSAELQSLVRSPLISKEKQCAVLDAISAKAKYHNLSRNFLAVLAQNRRLASVVEIIRAVEKKIAERKGLADVSIVTAVALTEPQKKDLHGKIASSLGRDVALTVDVDPAILGGMIVTIGSYMIDDSVRRKLERLNVALTQGANTNTLHTLKEVV